MKKWINKILKKRITRLILARLILIACIPIIVLDSILAIVIMLKNWTFNKTKEINDV